MEETFPSYFYGPNDQAQVFDRAEDVPAGWADHPSKVKAKSPKPQLDHDNKDGAGGSLPDEPPALAGKNKADLLEIAAAEGAEVAEGATNSEIRAAIEAKRAE